MRRIEIVLLYFSHVRSSKHPFLIYLIHLFAPFYYYYYYFSLCTRKKLIKLDRKVEFIWKNNNKKIRLSVMYFESTTMQYLECVYVKPNDGYDVFFLFSLGNGTRRLQNTFHSLWYFVQILLLSNFSVFF